MWLSSSMIEGLALALEIVEVAGLNGLPDAIVGKLGKKVHNYTHTLKHAMKGNKVAICP